MESHFKQLENIYSQVIEFLVGYSFQLFGAMLIFCIGFYTAKKVAGITLKQCKKRNLDVTLSTFLTNVVKFLIIIVTAMICLGKIGIEITPFVAAMGAASLGAGLAIQGTLSNYCAGLTIIITRPFVVGNTITVNGVGGIVKEVKFAHTILCDEDGVIITIPNKKIIGEIVHNSFENTLMEGSIGVSYNTDINKALKIIEETLEKHTGVCKEPKAQVGINSFADSSIEISYRCWLPTEKFYEYKYLINKEVFRALKTENIDIPFPQREVRMIHS
jgi:small conductance mechanosensitive channel